MNIQKIKRSLLLIAIALVILIGVASFMMVKNTIGVAQGVVVIAFSVGILMITYLIDRKLH